MRSLFVVTENILEEMNTWEFALISNQYGRLCSLAFFMTTTNIMFGIWVSHITFSVSNCILEISLPKVSSPLNTHFSRSLARSSQPGHLPMHQTNRFLRVWKVASESVCISAAKSKMPVPCEGHVISTKNNRNLPAKLRNNDMKWIRPQLDNLAAIWISQGPKMCQNVFPGPSRKLNLSTFCQKRW